MSASTEDRFAIANLTGGQLNAIVKRLGGEDGALRFLRGESEDHAVKHVIDCDSDPFTPDGWKVEEHKKDGKVEWSQTKVRLHLADGQKDGNVIRGDKLRKELAKEPVLNANVLDYLIKNPRLIPDEWNGKAVFFWGTIYRDSGGLLCVRYLYWCGKSWYWDYRWLVSGLGSSDPALVSAS